VRRMARDACLKVLARHVDEHDFVVAAYQAAFEWIVIRPSDRNLIATGAMGQASSHALGIAIGRPESRVLCLDGDGSLLMNLGSLVTIASVAPDNLVHFVCNNGVYEANGSHPTPHSDRVDYAEMARAAGYRAVHVFDDLVTFENAIAGVISARGPVFVDLRVEQGEAYPQDYAFMHGDAHRAAFKAAVRGA
jgi:sulfopyruvate decarboxylase subunit beta